MTVPSHAPTSPAVADPAIGMHRNKAIDGWRAVAASFVVFAHLINYRLGDIEGPAFKLLRRASGPLAEIGVQIFFVISGYIITTLLIKERASFGSISIRNFYARRFLRILPPLAAYIATICILDRVGLVSLSDLSLLKSATFTCNAGTVDCDWWVAHSWSLAVEEQFYVFWPVLFVVLPERYRAAFLAGVVIVCSIYVALTPIVFHNNFTSFSCIAAGALYATHAPLRTWLLARAHLVSWLLAVAVLTIVPFAGRSHWVEPLLPALIVYIVFIGAVTPAVRAILVSAPFQIVGLASYSLYLWQQLFLAKPSLYLGSPPSLLLLPVAVGLSVLLFERPFIAISKRHFTRSPDAGEVRAAPAA